jgi:hypothetical protein
MRRRRAGCPVPSLAPRPGTQNCVRATCSTNAPSSSGNSDPPSADTGDLAQPRPRKHAATAPRQPPLQVALDARRPHEPGRAKASPVQAAGNSGRR